MKHMVAMIAAVWILSALISIPPLFGWRQDLPPVNRRLYRREHYHDHL